MDRYKRWTDTDGDTVSVSRFDDGEVVIYTLGRTLLKPEQIKELIEHLKGESE